MLIDFYKYASQIFFGDPNKIPRDPPLGPDPGLMKPKTYGKIKWALSASEEVKGNCGEREESQIILICLQTQN